MRMTQRWFTTQVVRARRYLIATAAACFAVFANSADIEYTLRQATCDSKPCLRIELTFANDRLTTTALRLPSDYAGSTGAVSAVRELRASGKQPIELKPADSGLVRLDTEVNERVTVNYLLLSGADQLSGLKLSTTYLPVIEPKRARLLGYTALVIPLLPQRTGRTASLRFLDARGEPMFVRTNLGPPGERIEFHWSAAAIGASVMFAGDYVAHMTDHIGTGAGAAGVTLLVSGNEPACRDFDAMARSIAVVKQAIDGYWGSTSDTQLIYFGEITDSRSSMKGSAFGNVFLTFATASRAGSELIDLWMHELNHAWLPQRMLSPGGRREKEFFWFTEGFTEYVTHWLLQESGIRGKGSLSEALLQARQRLSEIAFPEPYAALDERFHKDLSAFRQVYDRGLLLAALWDIEIQQKSDGTRSLRDVLRGLITDGGERVSLDVKVIEQVMGAGGVADAAGDIDRFVNQGRVPPATALGRYRTVTR